MRYLCIKRNVEKVWGARYKLGACYLSKNTVIHILPPIYQRSIIVLSLTIFLMFFAIYLLFLLEFQIVRLNYLVSSTMDMQSSDLLAVTAELFHWQW